MHFGSSSSNSGRTEFIASHFFFKPGVEAQDRVDHCPTPKWHGHSKHKKQKGKNVPAEKTVGITEALRAMIDELISSLRQRRTNGKKIGGYGYSSGLKGRS